MNIQVETNAAELAADLRAAWPDFAAAIGDGLVEMGEAVVEAARELAPEASGTLRSMLGTAVQPNGIGTQVSIFADVPYGEAVEFGSAPHQPPIGPLVAWVGQRLGVTGPAGVSLAHRIAQRVAQRGTAPRPYLLPGIDAAEPRCDAILEQSADRAMARLAGD
jgi:hypothetical protein